MAALLIALLGGCAPPAPAPVPTMPTATRAVPTALPIAIATATAMPASTATATRWPTPPPTATRNPVQQFTLVVPEVWQEVARTAVAAANADAAQTGFAWTLADKEGLRLQAGAEGLLVGQTPLALAVPFTLDWEEVSRAEAEHIQRAGHETVVVLPWHALAAGDKALRVEGRGPDDPDYPLQQPWSLFGGTAVPAIAAQSLRPYLQSAWPSPPVHLLAVGDIMLDRSLGAALERGDLAYPFKDVAERLRAADIAIGNLESALGDQGEPQPKRYPFRAPALAAAALAQAGFDVLSLANNHAMDYGPEALAQALDLLTEANVATAGAGRNAAAAHAPAILQRNGLRIAFLSYVNVPVEASTGFDTAVWTATDQAAGLAWAAPEEMRVDIVAARTLADLVVVALHSGFEYQAVPSEVQQTAARAAVDAGANLVIGHHTHILQGIEWYEDGVILYGTGNFAFDIDGDPATALFHVWLDKDGVREVQLEPAIVQYGGQPRLAEPWLAPGIRSTVYALTKSLNSR